MLNTLSSDYQESIKVWKLNPVYQASSETNNREIISYVTPGHDTIAISDEAKSFMRMDEIDQELDAIFGAPDKLSTAKQRELNKIMAEIDKIYVKDNADAVDAVYNQIDAIYAQGEITESEKNKLALLDEELNDLFIQNSNANISQEDEGKLAVLNAKLDALYGTQEPSVLQLTKAESLQSEKETLFAALFVEKGLKQTYNA